jgi:peptidyl-prolyl cis-trans isomerase SurA
MMSRTPLAASLALVVLAAVPAFAQDAVAQPRASRAATRPAEPPADSGLAEQSGRIAAVVNEDAITTDDLEGRLRLALVSSQLPDNAEVRARLKPQVLRNLIEEQLQIQEARRLQIRVEPTEIENAIEGLAKSNNMTRQDLQARFRQAGIPFSTMQSQAVAQIAWSRVVQKQIRPRVEITQDEVDDAYEKLKASAGKPQFLMAEIFLAVDNPSQDGSVQQTADRLIEEIRRGANFAAVARQFSQSADAANGGDLGWVQEGQLGDEIDAAIRELKPGMLGKPVRDAAGYHILYMRDRGTVLGESEMASMPQAPTVSPNDRLYLKQILLPPPQQQTKESVEALVAEARRLLETVQGCDAIDARAKTDKLSGTLGTVRLRDLPGPVQQVVAELPEGRLATPLQTPAGLAMLMVCKRTPAEVAPEPVRAAPKAPQIPTKDAVLNQIGGQRLEMQARRYLRDLRAQAYVDVRV